MHVLPDKIMPPGPDQVALFSASILSYIEFMAPANVAGEWDKIFLRPWSGAEL